MDVKAFFYIELFVLWVSSMFILCVSMCQCCFVQCSAKWIEITVQFEDKEDQAQEILFQGEFTGLVVMS